MKTQKRARALAVAAAIEESAPQPLAQQTAMAALENLSKVYAGGAEAVKTITMHLEASERSAAALKHKHAQELDAMEEEKDREIESLENKLKEAESAHQETKTATSEKIGKLESNLALERETLRKVRATIG